MAASLRLQKRFWSDFKSISEGTLKIFVMGLQTINFESESFESWRHKFDFYNVIIQRFNVLRKASSYITLVNEFLHGHLCMFV